MIQVASLKSKSEENFRRYPASLVAQKVSQLVESSNERQSVSQNVCQSLSEKKADFWLACFIASALMAIASLSEAPVGSLHCLVA